MVAEIIPTAPRGHRRGNSGQGRARSLAKSLHRDPKKTKPSTPLSPPCLFSRGRQVLDARRVRNRSMRESKRIGRILDRRRLPLRGAPQGGPALSREVRITLMTCITCHPPRPFRSPETGRRAPAFRRFSAMHVRESLRQRLRLWPGELAHVVAAFVLAAGPQLQQQERRDHHDHQHEVEGGPLILHSYFIDPPEALGT